MLRKVIKLLSEESKLTCGARARWVVTWEIIRAPCKRTADVDRISNSRRMRGDLEVERDGRAPESMGNRLVWGTRSRWGTRGTQSAGGREITKPSQRIRGRVAKRKGASEVPIGLTTVPALTTGVTEAGRSRRS